MIEKFLNHENGATAIEYGLIAALISVVIITSLAFVGGEMTNMYSTISSAIDGTG